jgi:hypothetical protein
MECASCIYCFRIVKVLDELYISFCQVFLYRFSHG